MLNKLTLALVFVLPLISACGNNAKTKAGLLVPAGTTEFNVTAANAPTSYTINGIENGSLTLRRNLRYNFTIKAAGHPFYIFTVQNTNPANAYTNGVFGNGTEVGSLTFIVPSNAPNTLYYGSSADGGMSGTIAIEN